MSTAKPAFHIRRNRKLSSSCRRDENSTPAQDTQAQLPLLLPRASSLHLSSHEEGDAVHKKHVKLALRSTRSDLIVCVFSLRSSRVC